MCPLDSAEKERDISPPMTRVTDGLCETWAVDKPRNVKQLHTIFTFTVPLSNGTHLIGTQVMYLHMPMCISADEEAHKAGVCVYVNQGSACTAINLQTGPFMYHPYQDCADITTKKLNTACSDIVLTCTLPTKMAVPPAISITKRAMTSTQYYRQIRIYCGQSGQYWWSYWYIIE